MKNQLLGLLDFLPAQTKNQVFLSSWAFECADDLLASSENYFRYD